MTQLLHARVKRLTTWHSHYCRICGQSWKHKIAAPHVCKLPTFAICTTCFTDAPKILRALGVKKR